MGALRGPAAYPLFEPVPVPLVPVSGIAEIRTMPDGHVVVVYYHLVPGMSPDLCECERHVAARLQWMPDAIAFGHQQFKSFLTAGPVKLMVG